MYQITNKLMLRGKRERSSSGKLSSSSLMTVTSSGYGRYKHASWKLTNIGFATIGAVVVLLLYFGLRQQGTAFGNNSHHASSLTISNGDGNHFIAAKISESLDSLKLGTASGVPYYRCTVSDSQESASDLVLLHGSAFSKEDWRTSGILGKLCEAPEFTSIVALDLSVKADYNELNQVLRSLARTNEIGLPLAAIVTPSASGATILEWVKNGNHSELRSTISRWIPVASNAVLLMEESALLSIRDWPILSIYGTLDSKGKESSLRLKEESRAQTLEIPGRHPCYLDSPEAFILAVRSFARKADR